MLATVPGVWHVWFHEVTRVGANTMRPDPWYQYVTIVRLAAPVDGVGAAGHRLRRGRPDFPARRTDRDAAGSDAGPARSVYALLLLLVPLLVMSFFRERKERYLLPMAAPAAVLAARALALYLRHRSERRPDPAGWVADAVTWATAAVLAVGTSVLGATHRHGFLSADGVTPWFTPAAAAAAAGLAAAVLLAGLAASRRWPAAGVVAVVLACWVGAEMQFRGYFAAEDDGKPQQRLADELWRRYPDAVVYATEPPTRYGNLSLASIVLSLYFDRVVRPRPASLPAAPGERPLVLLTEAPDDKPRRSCRGGPGWRRRTPRPQPPVRGRAGATGVRWGRE